MKLYSYFRSSASYRVRIALNLKGLPYEYVPVHLVRGGGEQLAPTFRAMNPSALVPVLVDETQTLSQSLAIIECIDELHPEPPLLPGSAADRARIRSIALAVACEIHPINNLRVLKYLSGTLKVDEQAKNAWYRHWVEVGLAAIERMLAHDAHTGYFCHGHSPSLADCCLVPQIYNAQRFNCQLDDVPTVMRVFNACMRLEAFQRAAPSAQPDAE